MRPPNTMSSMCFWTSMGRVRPTSCGAFVRKMGSSTMNAAPRNEPSRLPSPPMITMNSTSKDRSIEYASLSALPR